MSDEPYYVANGTNTSSDGQITQCPRCENGVAVNFPETDCPHCGQTITFVVAEKGSIPQELADWGAAQSEFQELRTQVTGQEDFIQEHEDRLDRLEEFEASVPELDGIDDRVSRLEELVQRLVQFEDVVRDQLEEMEDE